MENTKSTENRYIDENDGLQLMIFTINNEFFAVNVADVREIMKAMPITPMKNAQKNIEGVYKPRDTVITVIDLAKYFAYPPAEDPEHDIFIITDCDDQLFSFHVH